MAARSLPFAGPVRRGCRCPGGKYPAIRQQRRGRNISRRRHCSDHPRVAHPSRRPAEPSGSSAQPDGRQKRPPAPPVQTPASPVETTGRPLQPPGRPAQPSGRPAQASGSPEEASGRRVETPGRPKEASGRPKEASGSPVEPSAFRRTSRWRKGLRHERSKVALFYPEASTRPPPPRDGPAPPLQSSPRETKPLRLRPRFEGWGSLRAETTAGSSTSTEG